MAQQVTKTFKATLEVMSAYYSLAKVEREDTEPNLELTWAEDGKTLISARVLCPWQDYAKCKPYNGERIRVRLNDATQSQLWYYNSTYAGNVTIMYWRPEP